MVITKAAPTSNEMLALPTSVAMAAISKSCTLA
jgi:hypothetical protein